MEETVDTAIVVGTDFSKGSVVALEIAVDIANKMQTDIRLVWVRKEKNLLSNDQMELAQKTAEERLANMCEQFGSRMASGRMHWEVSVGKVAQAIGEIAQRYSAPMIVIGTNGASGFEKYWMGSTAVRIVQESPCPVLTVREGFDFHKTLDNIVVPIRVNANSRQKVEPAAFMAKVFGSSIHVLGLYEGEEEKTVLQQYVRLTMEFLQQHDIEATEVFHHYENYSQTVLAYAEEVHADLIVINTEQDKLLARLFLGTNAQQMVHHSQIPILCIHPEDINGVAR